MGSGDSARQVRRGLLVVRRHHVAPALDRPMAARNLDFKRHDGLRFAFGVGLAGIGELACDVSFVLIAQLRELAIGAQVIIPIRHAEAGLTSG